MSDFDLTKLREIAEAATPGPWKFATAPAEGSDETAIEYLGGALTGYGPLCVVWIPETLGDPDGYRLTAATGDGPHALMDATHIAAFDPPTVLSLLDEIERLQRWKREAKQIFRGLGDLVEVADVPLGHSIIKGAIDCITELRKEIDSLQSIKEKA